MLTIPVPYCIIALSGWRKWTKILDILPIKFSGRLANDCRTIGMSPCPARQTHPRDPKSKKERTKMKMKKLLALMLAAVMALSLAACGDSGSKEIGRAHV